MKPRIVVLSAPSGGGKTTIARAVRDQFPDRFGFSVSATTRKPRPGEVDGEAYHFISRDDFVNRREAGEFLESAEYAGELYGTPKDEVDRVRKSGRHVLLDIEVDGAEQVKQLEPDAIRLFILPSSPQVWMDRLVSRKTESLEQIRKRLSRAGEELKYATSFDRFITNDDLDEAIAQVVRAVDEGGGVRSKQREIGSELALLSSYRNHLQHELQRLNAQIHPKRG